MSMPKEVSRLIEKFDQHLESYRSGKYNEAQLRNEFLNPFFKSLGWDMNNDRGLAEAYKDVVHEDAIRIGGAVKAPDYCFRIGGTRKFFLEAKKPSVDIGQETSAAYQVRRYAWSAKLPLSILSDFEEFAVYDCRVKPNRSDTAAMARVFLCRFQDYPEKWDWISSIFSKEAILKGSFDKYAEKNRAKRGTSEVDDDFLATIECWRSDLAKNIALRNSRLSQRELNFAVQRIIDRIVFLRICEDRGSELYGRLQGSTNGPHIYQRLCEVFEDADGKYNSGLFYFKAEKGRHESPDEITLGLDLDDKLLRDLLRGLYYPESPYEFTVISSDILGQVYEQFLGKVIRLTEGHRAVVEDKPEVKKAGGVYYTPTYIVDYIVRQTVGRLIEGKTPKQVSKLRILDPACGSGSFLINAYQFLLDWHHDWYLAHKPETWAKGRNPVLVQTTAGWKLTIAERKRILLDNIYGVDIDSQAVEVTKLSLLLKVLEGESEQTIQPYLRLFSQRALPDLGDNIKCGNSLVGSEAFQDALLSLLPEEDQYRINMFDWNSGFPEIIRAGGFDAVIGNPPYIRIQTMKEWAPTEVELYKKLYKSASSGNYDIYVVFIEKGLGLLNKHGRLGFILPHKFFNAQYGREIREIISKGRFLGHVVHFGDQQIFEAATTYTCLLFINKEGCDECQFIKVDDLKAWRLLDQGTKGVIPAKNILAEEWNFVVGKEASLFEKMNKMPSKLGNIADIFVGLQTSADDVYILESIKTAARTVRLKSKALDADWVFEKGLLFPIISGTDVNRYCELPERQYVIFPYKVENGLVRLVAFDEIAERYPKTAAYLLKNKETLEGREKGKGKGPRWYGYIYLKNMIRQSTTKLCIPRLVDKLYAAFDEDGKHFLDNVDVGGITFKEGYEQQGFKYLLGLLNSRLLRWYFPLISAPFRGGWMSANRQFLSQLPICVLDFANPVDAEIHNQIRNYVDHILKLHKTLTSAKTPHEKESFQRQIDSAI
jgi:hypothetical protein